MSNIINNKETIKSEEEPTVNKSERQRTPPQPPLRTNVNRGTLNRQGLSSPSPQTSNIQTGNTNQTPTSNQHESASSAAAKLVLKTAKMGSANSLTPSNNSNSGNNPAQSPYTKAQDGQTQAAGSHYVDNRLKRDSPSLSYTSSVSNGANKKDAQTSNKNSLPWALLSGELIVNKDESKHVEYIYHFDNHFLNK